MEIPKMDGLMVDNPIVMIENGCFRSTPSMDPYLETQWKPPSMGGYDDP